LTAQSIFPLQHRTKIDSATGRQLDLITKIRGT